MRDIIEAYLRHGPQTREALQLRLGQISQPTLSRQLATMPQVLVMGQARATRYGLRRSVLDLPSALPVYRIDEQAVAQEIGLLHAVHGGWWFEDRVLARRSAWFDGLPWFLSDMRPQGFLGLGFARRHPDLPLPARLNDWQDDHVVYALARRGEDAAGNLILGEESLTRWLTTPVDAIALRARTRRYPQMAQAALAGEQGGSSAGGEQPKFTATLEHEAGARQVLVKFSESLETEAGRRWGDLLIAEHHALLRIRDAGLPAASSQLLHAGDRIFLELHRFDRVHARGRRGLISLAALDDQFVGRRQSWLDTMQVLQQLRYVGKDDVQRVAWLQAFGQLIGNTDMHFGNLSLHYEGAWPMALAPAYDMLPMLYAPRRAEVLTPAFAPSLPVASGLEIAQAVRQAATAYWQAVADDERVSPAFREVCHRNAIQLDALRG